MTRNNRLDFGNFTDTFTKACSTAAVYKHSLGGVTGSLVTYFINMHLVPKYDL